MKRKFEKTLFILGAFALSLGATACGKGGTEQESGSTLPEHTHEYITHSAVQATCTTGGNDAYYTCDGCDKIFNLEKNEINAIPTTTALGHSTEGAEWQRDGEKHWKNCIRDNCDYTEAEENHKGGTATCNQKAVCEVCGEEYGTLAEHTVTGITAMTETTEYTAFDTVDTQSLSVKALCENCDGFDVTDITVTYANGNSLQYGDEYFTVNYGTFTTQVAVTVAKKSVAVVWTADEKYICSATALSVPTATVENEQITLTVAEKDGKTFQTAGEYTFVATTENENYALTNTEKNITVTHNYGVATYSWKEEGTSWVCAGEIKCPGCNGTIAETATGVYSVVTEVGCETDGEGKYTATFTDKSFETQEKTGIVIAKTGHDMSDFAVDYNKAVGKKYSVCKNGCGKEEVDTSATYEIDFTKGFNGAKLLAPDGTDMSGATVSETNTNKKVYAPTKNTLSFHLYESDTYTINLPRVDYTRFEVVYIPMAYTAYEKEMGVGFAKDTLVTNLPTNGSLTLVRVSATEYTATFNFGTKSVSTTVTDAEVLSGAKSLVIYANGLFAVERFLTIGEYTFYENVQDFIKNKGYEVASNTLNNATATTKEVFGMPTYFATYNGYHFRPDEVVMSAVNFDFSNAKEVMFGFKVTKDVAHMMASTTYVTVPKDTWAFVKAVNEEDTWKVYMSYGTPFNFTEQPKLTTLFADREKNLKQLFDFLSWENIEYTVTATQLYVKVSEQSGFDTFIQNSNALKICDTAIQGATLQTEKLNGENYYKYTGNSYVDASVTTNITLISANSYSFAVKITDNATMGSGNPAVGVKLDKDVWYYVTANHTESGWVISTQTKYSLPKVWTTASGTFGATNFNKILCLYLTQYGDWATGGTHPFDIYVTGVYETVGPEFNAWMATEIASWNATKLQDNAMARGEKESYTLGGQNVYKATNVANGYLGADVAIGSYNEVYFTYKSETTNKICGGGNPELSANTWYIIKIVRDGDNFQLYKKTYGDADYSTYKSISVSDGQWFKNDFNVYNWTENVSGNMVVYSLGIWVK